MTAANKSKQYLVLDYAVLTHFTKSELHNPDFKHRLLEPKMLSQIISTVSQLNLASEASVKV